jgi:hypothetical protein
MKKYLIAIVIAFGALFALSVQAAPLTEHTTAIQSQVAQQDATQKVYYRHGWRRGYGWRGYGWRRGWGWRGYGWRRGWGWRGYGWRGYGYGCRLRCNPWRCWRVCW